ncbi:MAG: hypothetical protein COX79_04090 [Candidatus Levybacteria bacterium CG_4_10_14_0_2_um_filter_36_16]|nr:MAG: hypothetical protein AUK12_04760 [Candidatus Levybacteria bacterium CG2_30_37_29]PIR79005.1 MAG: hypothetical protein COU26_03465 [Candidatus Levybacteria bacterium CG10_big_fil_rev_8_21_14_0_10_36_30]PIZ96893.1 MAG: hypothetical protein COX79_04090 [Candidatus Levybacteria bacterium CG_4_10_14_0_2_um_filter_36_16]
MNQIIERVKNYKYFYPVLLIVSLFAGTFLILFVAAMVFKQEKKQEPKRDGGVIVIGNPTIKPVITIPAAPTSGEKINPVILQGTSIFYPALYQNYIYYLSDAGTRFYKIKTDGKEKAPISDVLVAQIKNVTWSQDGLSAVIQVENNKYFLGKNNSPFFSEKDENLATTNWLYAFQTKTLKQIDTSAIAFSFSPSGRLYYISVERPQNAPPQTSLYALDTNSTKILTFPERQNLIYHVSENTIITSTSPGPLLKNISYYQVSTTTKEVTKIPPPPNTFGALVSPSGNYLVVQTVEKEPTTTMKIGYLDIANKAFYPTQISGDVKKSAWGKKEQALFLFNENTITKISFPGLKTQVFSLPKEISLSSIDDGSLMVGDDNKSFFFTNNNSLYSISF